MSLSLLTNKKQGKNTKNTALKLLSQHSFPFTGRNMFFFNDEKSGKPLKNF
jgi:hypothetical protein